MRLAALIIIGCALNAASADAQIYSWRDGSGRLVLSNKPGADGAAVSTYAVPGTQSIRTTSAVEDGEDASRFDTLIRQYAARHGVSSELVKAVIQAESAFNPRAISPKGAMGLMQLMPATARELGVSNPFHPEENIRAGVAYLAQLLDRFNRDVRLALAAYNAGPASVERYEGVPPYRETRDYVKKITAKTAAAAATDPVIYKWIELVDGRPIARYSNTPPKDTSYEPIRPR